MFLDVEWKHYGRLLKIFAVAHLPVVSACAEVLFGGKFSWERKNLVTTFCVLSQKKFVVCQKYFRMVAAIAVKMSRGAPMGRNPIPEKLCNFKIVSGFSANCLWTNARNISAELPHLHCSGADDVFFWMKYKDIRFFLILSEKMFSCPKKINRVIAMVVQITRRTSSIKKQILRYYEIRNLFSEFGCSVYGHLLKIFLQSFRTCFVRVQRNTLRTFFERSIINIITSGLWAKKLVAYGNIFSRVVASAVYFSFVRVQSNVLRTFSE